MATVSDVAGRAGVSVSTASRVLSGRGYASADTRRVVLQAARELGFVPNQIARSLRTRRTRMIGLLIGDVENPFYSTLASNVESVTRGAGYHVVLCNSNDNPEIEKEYLNLLEGMRVDGLVVTPTPRNRAKLADLLGKGVVIVQIDRVVEGLHADAILVDNEAGAHRAVEYMIAAGHTRIGILPGDLDVATARQRLAGYERALCEHGIPIREQLIRPGSFHRERAIEDATELIKAHPAPTALLAANNLLAEGTLVALADHGLRVPRDMSVVAFDDVPWMPLLDPPITAVRQPVADIARTAAELMLRRLGDDAKARPNTVIFRTELVERGSVAAPRRERAASGR
jgi:LacI family transcriptional regulator